ncbi:MAG: pentapeptide repeat-containing protein [Phycisphaerales bacterium]|nr:pentapeptide repeat-containing protein [Phycisphaerales bacterium]
MGGDQAQEIGPEMTRDKALELLNGWEGGVEEWNEWRKEYPKARIPSLERGSFNSPCHLEGANLSHANLRETNLDGANLRYADLREANLSEANLNGADLSETNLRGANLRRANLSGANLSGADPIFATLSEELVGPTELRKAKLIALGSWGRALDIFWTLYSVPYLLNETITRNTRFDRRARDPWSVLRRNYTGPNMIFVLLFTIAAFLPVIAKVTFWSAVSRWQESAAPMALEAIQRTSEFLAKTPDPAWSPWVERAQELTTGVNRERITPRQIRETIELLSSSTEIIEAYRKQTNANAEKLEELKQIENRVTQAQEAVRILGDYDLKERRVFSLVLGTDDGWYVVIFSAVLLIYNAARAILTYFVGPLRDDEERVGVSPALGDYRWLWRVHQFTSPVLAISILVGIARILSGLWSIVLVPG